MEFTHHEWHCRHFHFGFIVWRSGGGNKRLVCEAKERWLLRRPKIEEIYLSSAAWLKYVAADRLRYLLLCNGSLSYKQVLDLVVKNADNAIGDQHLKMKMNIAMYEPSLVPRLELMERELKNLNSVINKIEDRCKKNEQVSEFQRELNNRLEAFIAAGDALTGAVVSRGAEIGAERGQVARAYELASVKIMGYTGRCRLYISNVWDQVNNFMRPKH